MSTHASGPLRLVIDGIATAVPAHSVAQSEIVRRAVSVAGASGREKRSIEALYRRSGIERRGSVLIEPGTEGGGFPFLVGSTGGAVGPGTADRMERFSRESVDLAERAARAALGSAGVSASRVKRLVVVTCTGFFAPGPDIALIRRLGLAADVKRAQIGFMGCHGALNGLEVARSMALTGAPGDRVLLAAVEICSLHAQSGMDPDDIVANAIFADGAAALVGRVDREGDRGAWKLADTSSVLIPDSADAMTWRIGDRGFRMTLSAKVPELVRCSARPAVERWLATMGMNLADVRSWAVHPGGVRILDAVEGALGLEAGCLDASRTVLRRHGNMSSPTVLFVLDELRRRGAGLPCVAMAFGPGLTVELALFEE